MKACFQSTLIAPRWACIPQMIRGMAKIHGVAVLHLQIKKGWLRETTEFAVDGPDLLVAAFRISIRGDLERYGATDRLTFNS